MKKITLLATLLMATNCFAAAPAASMPQALDAMFNYKDVVTAVANGHDIRIGLILKDCTMNGKKIEKPIFKVGLYSPNEVILSNDDNVVASLRHFTKNDARAPGKPVWQYAVYTITPDDNVKLSVEVLDAETNATVVNKETYDCKLGVASYVLSK